MSQNKLENVFDPSEFQWQGKHEVFNITDLTRDDLLQVVCACLSALEEAESLCFDQRDIFHDLRYGETRKEWTKGIILET